MKSNSSSAPSEDSSPNSSYTRKNLRELPTVGRTLPHSLEAEEYLLSCCLLDGQSVVKRCHEAKLKPEAFYLNAHGTIYGCIVDLFERGLPIEVAVVAEELKKSKQLDAVGGYQFLAQVSALIPTQAQTGYFIDTVIELAILRRIIRDGTETVELAYSYSGELAAFAGAIASKFQVIADFVMNRARKVTQKSAVKNAREEALLVAAGKVDKTRWLHFPVPKLDAEFLPIDTRQEDWLNLVAAPPSGGKSSKLRWLAGHWLQAGRKGVVFLLETSRKRWIQALAASYAGINLRNLEDASKLFPRQFEEFTQWMEVIEEWAEERLWIYDDVIALEDIVRVTRDKNRELREREIAAGLSEDEAHGLDFVIGDYLQIVTTRRQFMKRTEELSHITRALKQLHKTLNVPGFWGAQITREARNEGRRPTLADLGESKSLEENADRVLFVHVPVAGEDGESRSEGNVIDVEIIQRKSRNGPKDVAVPLQFDRPVSRFSDPSRKGYAQNTPAPKSGRISKGDFR